MYGNRNFFDWCNKCLCQPKEKFSNIKAHKRENSSISKVYTDKVDSQVKIVKHGFYDLYRDIHKLYPKYNTASHPQGHGTYQGHIGRYNKERKDLGQYITEATLSKCEKYVSAEARK